MNYSSGDMAFEVDAAGIYNEIMRKMYDYERLSATRNFLLFSMLLDFLDLKLQA